MRSIYNRTLLSVALVIGCGTAAASTPSSTAVGLGQSWPNTTDVSASSHYHVYLFDRAGVRYVQVNDAAGTVRGAIAVVDGETLDLPIGVDASRWRRVSETAAIPAESTSVYSDDAMRVVVAPQPDGAASLLLVTECNDPTKCSIRGP
ncbi:hypothetical protein J2X57_002756 [Luteibacter sp. 1214]|uniref:hypothetical protein n=1 Tax=Luteibacter sp. 1214 TaxID=2817735 RepID=UPI00285F5BEE|nr:hypothetical protein [Luteibacter sp. 1214]MDR6643535.1 hypothetical protein [Luteibacter sp. 1214]